MKAFIIGIAGATGLRLAKMLKGRGDEVDGLYRRPDQQDRLAQAGVSGTLGDIVSIREPDLANAMAGTDAIVFCAGAGGKDGDEMTDKIDGDGVIKAIKAATLAGVRRFYLVSVFPEAWRERPRDEGFEHYIRAKKRADVALSQSDLDWVILRPSELRSNAPTGLIDLGYAQFHTLIERDDLAATLTELIHTPEIRRVILEVTGGSTPIAEAVSALRSDLQR
jgi:uncharacterized protein YbjT (DUF2867 family)